MPASLRRRGSLALAVLLLVAAGGSGAARAGVPAWTTYHHDGARSGIDPDSVSPAAPSLAWQTPSLDGPVYGQPLVYGSRVFVATENNTVYALDAATGAVIWHASAGLAVDPNQLPCGDIKPAVGITSTPVIDPGTNRVYVVADAWDGSDRSSIHHQLVSFDLDTGAPSSPAAVDPPGSDHTALLQRPGLALDGSEIVIGYGGNAGDCGSYHGWLVGVNEDGTGSLRTFEADPNHSQGAIWGSGNAPALDGAGNVYAATGNGSSGSSFDFGETVVKLSPALGTPLDYWAPTNWASLDSSDTDVGSSEPLLLPGGLVAQAGKDGNAYLLNAGAMGHVHTPVAELDGVCSGTFGGGVYVAGTIYLACSDGLRALSLDTSTPGLSTRSGWSAPSGAIGPPIYAGGLVWSAGWKNGILYGLNPQTGAVVFSTHLGSFNHFSSPSAGGGRLFVANGSKVTALKIANYVPSGASGPGSAALRMTGVWLTRRAPRAAQGTRLRLTLSRSAKISVRIFQRLSGRRVDRRCKANVRRGKRCVRRVKRRLFLFSGRLGSNSLKLRIAGLRPGAYEVVVLATATGGRASKTVRLTIKRPRHRRRR